MIRLAAVYVLGAVAVLANFHRALLQRVADAAHVSALDACHA